MRILNIIGAVFLGLLAIGTFPFNPRILATSGGMILAILSLLLAFFALRLGAPGLFRRRKSGDSGPRAS